MADRESYPSPTAAQMRAGPGPFYGNGDMNSHEGNKEHFSNGEISQLQLSGGMDHINPDLQNNNIHPSHIDSYAVTQAHDHALAQSVMSLQNHHLQPNYQHISVSAPGHSNAMDAAAAAAAAAAAKQQRSKVSRACDECRRKKIRCDATTENETSSCTSCRKSNMTCQFSRTPQKRGPSKGYIKELADRVTTLERERQANGLDGNSPQPTGPALNQEDINFLSGVADATFAATPSVAGQKRSHSISEGFNDQYTSRERGGVPPEELVSIDENDFNSYLQAIHMTLPFLPREYHVLRSAVGTATEPTREAFQGAFDCTMKAIQYTGNPVLSLEFTPKRAYELLVNSNWMDTPNLLQLQALLLLLLESSNRGSQVIHGGHGNSPWQYLNEAVTKGKAVEQFSLAFYPPPVNPDNHYLISRAVVLSMIILDAFLALGNKKQGSSMDPALMTVWDQDLGIVGQRCYKLARLARILSRLAHTRITDSQDDYELHRPTRVTGSSSKPLRIQPEDTDIILRLKNTDMDLLQAHDVPDDPVLAMAFWYTRIQIEITYYPIAKSENILYPLRRIIEQLGHACGFFSSPITHHFSGLAAHLLIQLCKFANTKDEAASLLILLSDTLQVLVNPEDTQSFDAGIRDIVARKRVSMFGEPSMGLEHLANAAVGDGSHVGSSHAALQAAAAAAAKAAQAHMTSSTSFDGSLLSQEGYLTGLLSQ